jgi:F-type H+-transporting ATPase subunit epsilon
MSNTFTLLIQDAAHAERFDGVSAFVGEDASGSFGVMANHARMMTTLVTGLARFRTGDDDWEYLAMPGAVLYFSDNRLTLCTRHCLRDRDYGRISAALHEQLMAEEEKLRATRESLRRLEETLLKRLWEIGRRGE